MPGQIIVHFVMTRNRLFLPCRRIEVDIVTCPMTMQHAALLRQLPNKLTALHKAMAFVW